jgi:hypothetical protein
MFTTKIYITASYIEVYGFFSKKYSDFGGAKK